MTFLGLAYPDCLGCETNAVVIVAVVMGRQFKNSVIHVTLPYDLSI